MKKIILHSLLYALCFAFVTGCSKNVKAPVKTDKTTATTKTTTTTQTQNTGGHTCGGSSGSTSNNGGHY